MISMVCLPTKPGSFGAQCSLIGWTWGSLKDPPQTLDLHGHNAGMVSLMVMNFLGFISVKEISPT